MAQSKLGGNEKKVTRKELTAKVEMALRKRYCTPEWATFFEVWGETDRQADCITFNMYRSRGFEILGFEIKASRNDWLKELKNGCKADFFVNQCNEWYIVEAYKGIVKKQELPDGWGLMTLQGQRLYKKVKSDLNFKGVPSREFFVRMIQQSHNQNVSESVIWEAEGRGYGKGKKDALEDGYDLREYKEKAELVDKLNKMGLHLWHYDKKKIERIIVALKIIEFLGRWGIDGTLKYIEDECKTTMEKIKECRSKLEALKEIGKEGDSK